MTTRPLSGGSLTLRANVFGTLNNRISEEKKEHSHKAKRDWEVPDTDQLNQPTKANDKVRGALATWCPHSICAFAFSMTRH